MKWQINFTLILLFWAVISYGQSPNKFNYQAVLRNSQGTVLANQAVTLRVSILDGTSSGNIQYSEIQTATTSGLGLITLAIGDGINLAGDFNDITWEAGDKYIKIEMDPSGGNNFSLVGTNQLLSVPYALSAGNASQWKNNQDDIYYNKGRVFIGGDAIINTDDYPGDLLQISSATHESRILLHGVNGGSNYNSVGLRNLSDKSGWDINHKSAGGIDHQFVIDYYDGELNTYNFECFKITSDGKTGFGVGYNESPSSKVTVKGGDINITDIGSGLIMKSANGQCWRMTVSNTGQAVFSSIQCP